MSVAQLAKIILEYKFDQGKVNLLAEKYGAKSEQVWRERVATNNRFKQKLLDPITIASFVPTYNAVSRITQEVKTIDQTQKTYSFTRDDEDQMVTATYPNSTSYAWTYDERNNRTSQRTVTASTDITETYIYNKADQLTSMEKRNTSNQQLLESYSYSYDNIGQMVTKTKTSVTPNEVTEYDYYVGGNLKQVTLPDDSEITFLYDAYGNRIQKATPDEVITYQYAAGSLRREIHKDDTNTTTLYTLNYYPWGLEKVVPAQGEDPEVVTPYYYVYDQKGFVQAIMDNDGDIVESYEYSPFGELLTTPTVTQFRFLSGREECIWDPETKLYYMHARYYDPVLGRFQTQDSMRGSMGSPISLNRYIYCQNDPVSLVDPSGNSPFNTGLPERWWEPGDQRLIDFTDSCTLPEIDHGSVRDGYLIEPMGPQCTVAYTDGVNVWVVSKFLLASGESVDINVLIGKKNKDGKTIDATLAEMKAFLLKQKQENIYGPLEGFIDGLIEGIEALYNGVLKIGEDGFSKILTSAVNESNLINKECWSDFQTEYTGSVNKYKPFAKHSIIGGYLATQISNASCLGVDTATQNRWNRYIGFAVSFMYEKSPRQNININNGAGKSDVIDLVGIANLCKGMALAEYQLRSEKARVGRGSFNDPKNIMNCNKDWWHKEDGTGNDNSHYMKGSFNDLTFDDICNSEFLSAIAGVSVLFSAADLLENDKTAFSRRKDRPANNSVFFWLESARRFSCGPNNTMNWYNRITTEKYLYFYSKLESKRYRESMAAFAGYWGIFPK